MDDEKETFPKATHDLWPYATNSCPVSSGFLSFINATVRATAEFTVS